MISDTIHSDALSFVAPNDNMIYIATLCDASKMAEEVDFDSAGGRLKWARERAGFLDAAQFARAAKMNPITYRAYEAGQNGFAKHAPLFAQRLGVPTEWLIAGGSVPDGDAPDPPPIGEFGTPEILIEKFGIELVRQVDIRYSMGDGSVIEDYPETGFLPFNRSFLDHFTRAPVEKVFIANGHGDSMEPTIKRDEFVMIDASQNRVAQQDQIWALGYAGTGMIKRLRRIPGGKYLILSDNPSVPPQEAEEDDVYIVGRVVWASRGL